MKRFLYILAVIFVPALMAFAPAKKKKIYLKDWIDFNKNGEKGIYEDPTQSINQRIDDLLSQMTMEEKTCQMVTLNSYPAWPKVNCLLTVGKTNFGNIDEASNGVYKEYKFEYDKHVWAHYEIQNFFIEKMRLEIPVEFTNEDISGLNHYKSTSFPAQVGMGSNWNKNLFSKLVNVPEKKPMH